MKEMALNQSELVGRGEDLGKLKAKLDDALHGKGSTVFIAGEAGIGKTRLVSELIKYGGETLHVVQGWCLAESLEPLFPFKTALREAGLFHLISGHPPPLVVSAYLMNEAGMLIAKAEREQTTLDPDIFAGMLQAVGNFVKDSLSMMENRGVGGLNSLGYGDYTIIIRAAGKLTLAAVIRGEKSEFLIEDMGKVLKNIGDKFDNWSGDVSATKGVRPTVSWFVDSGKYDGKFLVDDPKLKQENLFDNVLLGMQRASMERPLVLFLDDLQWADPTSLSLLHYLARNTRKDRALILGTYRPEDIVQSWDGKAHQLDTAMQNMSREGLLQGLELKRLERAGTESLIINALGASRFEPAFFEKIYRDTDGTPFFVLEVIKLLAEEGALKQDDGGIWKLAASIEKLDTPIRVYDVVKRRLDRLTKGQREILECASVVGEEFQSEVIGMAMEMNRLALLKNLSEIEKTHRLVHFLRDKYRFDHAKIKEVLYNGIGEELRKEYHRLIAETLAALHRDNLDEVVAELAHHYFTAGDERAGEYLAKAGDKAKDAYANEEAVKLYENAADLLEEEERLEILEKLGDVQALVGDVDKAIENFGSAKESTEHCETKARMLRKVADEHQKKSEYDRSLEVLAEAKGLVKEGTAEYGRITGSEGAICWRKGDYEKGLALFQCALKTFEEFGGERKDIGNALRVVGNIHWSRGEYNPALQHYEKSLAVMEEIAEQYGIAAALGNIGLVHHYRGELDRALKFYERSLEIRENIGDKRGAGVSHCGLAEVFLELKNAHAALEHAENALSISVEIGSKTVEDKSRWVLGMVHRAMGNLDKAEEEFLKSISISEGIHDMVEVGRAHYEYGLLLNRKGEPAKAKEHFSNALSGFELMGMKLWVEKARKSIDQL
ncbi:MAG: tetratricopeptide repeat protein [Euryarchaeota archaeon]|nr:tetratricopeptide repeat protein [Euryarchaeota archaeon]